MQLIIQSASALAAIVLFGILALYGRLGVDKPLEVFVLFSIGVLMLMGFHWFGHLRLSQLPANRPEKTTADA